MTKHDAIKLFGTVGALASALGMTRQAIYQWPEELPQAQVDRVVGAAIRVGKAMGQRPSVDDKAAA